jgi:hypothetical protein
MKKKILKTACYCLLLGSLFGCAKEETVGPITLIGKAYMYGTLEPIPGVVFEVNFGTTSVRSLGRVTTDQNGYFKKTIDPKSLPCDYRELPFELATISVPTQVYYDNMNYWKGVNTAPGVITFERIFYPESTSFFEIKKATKKFDQLEMYYEKDGQTTAYQTITADTGSVLLPVTDKVGRSKKIWIYCQNNATGLFQIDSAELTLKYHQSDTMRFQY